jgi:ligand-binding sensor domain-containing protein
MVLSHTSITAILQDHDGFLWIGAWSGLLKYDGYKVHQYKQEPGNINGLESNKITTLFEDSQHRLWVGTRNSGLYQYDRMQNRFLQYKKEPSVEGSLSNNNVWAIYEDHLGDIWVGTEKGLNLLLPESKRFVHFTHDPKYSQSLSYDFVYSITESNNQTLWIGTEEGAAASFYPPFISAFRYPGQQRGYLH